MTQQILQMAGLRKCAWNGCIIYKKAESAVKGHEPIIFPANQRMCCKCSNSRCGECEVHSECYYRMEEIAMNEVIRSKRGRVDTTIEISKGLWTHFTEIGKTPRFLCTCSKGNILPIVGNRREEVVVVEPGMGHSINSCGDHVSGWRLAITAPIPSGTTPPNNPFVTGFQEGYNPSENKQHSSCSCQCKGV
jgi:hypothetical protein